MLTSFEFFSMLMLTIQMATLPLLVRLASKPEPASLIPKSVDTLAFLVIFVMLDHYRRKASGIFVFTEQEKHGDLNG